MRRIASWLMVGAVVVTAPGCAKQLTRIETRTDEIATVQAQMATRQRELTAAIARLDERDAQREAELVERRAELEAQLDALDRVVRQLDARGQEQEQLLREIRAALDVLGRQRAVGTATPSTSSDETSADDANASDTADLQSPGQDVFDAAFGDYTSGRYGLAREGFDEILARFGSSELADDAHYWVAETWYAEGDYEQARAAFELTLEAHPNSEVVAPSLLKLAFCMVELGRPEAARDVLERLLREHPDSDEALIGEHRLTTLSEDD